MKNLIIIFTSLFLMISTHNAEITSTYKIENNHAVIIYSNDTNEHIELTIYSEIDHLSVFYSDEGNQLQEHIIF